MSAQTVIRDGVSVEKEARATASDGGKPRSEWQVTLTITSEHEYPVAIEVRDQIPSGVGPAGVALPPNDGGGECTLQRDSVSYRVVVAPSESTRLTYLLNADLADETALLNATTIDTLQPVDPAVDNGSGGAVSHGSPTIRDAKSTDGAIDGESGAETAATAFPPVAGNGTDSVARFETSEAAAGASDVLLPRKSDTDPLISFVMPTMNEEAGIATCIEWATEALGELGVTGEIIVSDSSDPDDRTPDIAAEAGAHVVTPDQTGYGYAYQYAFERTRGEYIVIGDADTTYDFRDLPRLLDRLQAADADMVMGSRLEGEIKPGAMPSLHQYVGNPLLTAFLNTFYDAGVSDAHSGFRVITRDALDDLDLGSDGMEFASEMIMQAAAQDLDIAEVPIVYHEREGEATLDSFRDGWRHVRFMLLNAPGYLFTGPALGLGLVGVVLMALSLLNRPIAGVYFGSHTMVAGCLAVIIGYQSASLGLFSAIAAEPIRTPDDPVTGVVLERFRLEHGATLGVGLFAAGALYVTFLVVRWVQSGFTLLPIIPVNLLGFTVIVLGIQTVLYSFFFSILGGTVADAPA